MVSTASFVFGIDLILTVLTGALLVCLVVETTPTFLKLFVRYSPAVVIIIAVAGIRHFAAEHAGLHGKVRAYDSAGWCFNQTLSQITEQIRYWDIDWLIGEGPRDPPAVFRSRL